MENFLMIVCCLLGSLEIWLRSANAEPVQYCKFGSSEHSNDNVDFCLGTVTHLNASTNFYDLYVTFTVTRGHGSALGWTAIGPGTTMADSVMFIVYGDPISNEDPIISIRTATGHTQPALISKSAMGAADIRVLQASWMPSLERFTPDNPTYLAKVSLVCYACHLWPGTAIAPESTSQPWIWAWNSKQEFPVYSYDGHLQMHKHHAGGGGWGNFYVDSARSINTAYLPSVPAIRPHVAALGASDTPGGPLALMSLLLSPSLHLHALFMGAAFLVLFPLGVVAMRSENVRGFKFHWIIQLLASLFLILGSANGLMLRQKIDTVHQAVGITLAISVGLQGVLGWRHHVQFVKLNRRTWCSHSHIWLGRLVMFTGWPNLITGMAIGGHRRSSIAVMAIVSTMECLGLAVWLWWRKRRETLQKDVTTRPESAWAKDRLEEHFALTAEGDEGASDSEQEEYHEKEAIV